jgi:hypothetical protein
MQRHDRSSAPIRAEEPGWREQAVCGLGVFPPELWFSRQARNKSIAKQVCLACPVLEQCTAYAVMSPVGQGIVAGMSPNQVYKLKRELRYAS